MARITRQELEGLRDQLLNAMPDAVRAVAVALRFSEAPAPSTPQAVELHEGVEFVTKRLSMELAAFERVFEDEHYQGRIFVYHRQDNPAWALSQIEFAGSRTMGGEAEHLRSLAEHLLTDEEEPSFALWVMAAPAPTGVNLYFLYARHHTGAEAVYVLKRDELHRLPLEGEQMDTLLGTVVPPLSLERGYWKRVLGSLAELATSELRPDIARHFEETLKTPLTPETWKELLKHFYLNMDFLRFQMEVGRSVATPVLQEAQVLLTALVEGLQRASAMFDERLAQAQKDHRRELKRRVNDHDKLNLSYQGLLRRAQRQAEELSRLQHQSRPANGAVTSTPSLGGTLRSFF